MKKYFKIVKDTATSIRARSVDVPADKIDEAVALVNEMHDYLVDSQDEDIAQKCGLREGVGLAAPQVGRNINVIAVYYTYEEGGEVKAIDHRLINPKIIFSICRSTTIFIT